MPYAYWRDIIEADPSKMYHQILTRIRAGDAFDARWISSLAGPELD
jgi:hypothetical protein